MSNINTTSVTGRFYSGSRGSGTYTNVRVEKRATPTGPVIQLHVPAAELILELTPHRMAGLVIELADLIDDTDLDFDMENYF